MITLHTQTNINCDTGSILMFTLQQCATKLAQYSGATTHIDLMSQFICVVFTEMALGLF